MVFDYGQELKFATGSYTGDGATSLAVAIGFKPKYVKVWQRVTGNGINIGVYETVDVVMDDNASGGAIEHISDGGHQFKTNAIISLDADGFTVDDGGSDLHPNKNTSVYNYMAIG